MTYDAANSVAIFRPSSELLCSTSYKATIKTGAQDTAGNALERDYSWTFKVRSGAGCPDTSFGEGGTVDAPSYFYFMLALQPDGKIILAGSDILVRYNNDGSLDTSFGSEGVAVLPTTGAYYFASAIQLDGKIVLSGRKSIFINNDFYSKVSVARFNSDGSVDGAFGEQGIAITDYDYDFAYSYSVMAQSDGKIVVIGSSDYPDYLAVARFNADGRFDTGFNGTGKVIGLWEADQGVGALAPDGKIVLAGIYAADFTIARLNEKGSLDTSFNGTGKVTTASGEDWLGSIALAIQNDGKIIISGGGTIIRYNNDGSLDSSFNGTGILRLQFFNSNALLIQPDGKILLSGNHLYRFNNDGSADETFNGTGMIQQGAMMLAVQSDGKILTGFYDDAGNFFLRRYIGM